MARRVTGSIPEVGSSRNITFEFPTSAIASDSLRLLPPLSYLAYLFLSPYNTHRFIMC